MINNHVDYIIRSSSFCLKGSSLFALLFLKLFQKVIMLYASFYLYLYHLFMR
jgi:hypothetical protein